MIKLISQKYSSMTEFLHRFFWNFGKVLLKDVSKGQLDRILILFLVCELSNIENCDFLQRYRRKFKPKFWNSAKLSPGDTNWCKSSVTLNLSEILRNKIDCNTFSTIKNDNTNNTDSFVSSKESMEKKFHNL